MYPIETLDFAGLKWDFTNRKKDSSPLSRAHALDSTKVDMPETLRPLKPTLGQDFEKIFEMKRLSRFNNVDDFVGVEHFYSVDSSGDVASDVKRRSVTLAETNTIILLDKNWWRCWLKHAPN